ncbi:MAG TPA: hypothetical protein VNN13_00955 [Methylomirabilota bacterium]|nr:hypothetical protein [Methylomirabilota bacterium]
MESETSNRRAFCALLNRWKIRMIRFEPQLHFAHVRIVAGVFASMQKAGGSTAMSFAPAAEMRITSKGEQKPQGAKKRSR